MFLIALQEIICILMFCFLCFNPPYLDDGNVQLKRGPEFWAHSYKTDILVGTPVSLTAKYIEPLRIF